MEIQVGSIVKAKHWGDNGKKRTHPFLIVNITKKNIFGAQCTSVKQEDNERAILAKTI